AADRRIIDLAGIFLRVGDEFGKRLRRNRGVYRQDETQADEPCDRCNVADEIEIEIVVEGGVDGVGGGHDEQGITVRGRVCDDRGADVARAARPVVDDELLFESL